jgi:AraC-like DNA-binding protein
LNKSANTDAPRSERSGRPDVSQPRLVKLAGRHRERTSCHALRPHIDRIWIFEVENACELELVPDGCIDIYWNGDQLVVAGPSTELVTVETPVRSTFVGARFAPGVAYRWLGVSARELLNAHVPLDDVWNRRSVQKAVEALSAVADSTTAASLLEGILSDRLSSVPPSDPMIEATIAAARAPAFEHGIVRNVVDGYGWSERTLRRRCEEAFGYGPKTLDRILRFQRFLTLLGTSRSALSHVAAAAGYADQAHLAREVRRLAGQSPSGLSAELHT